MKFLVSLATIAVLAISSVSIVSTGAQLPQQTAAVTGKIEGTVLRTGSNDPIIGARVTLTRINPTTGSPMQVAGTGGMSMSNTGPGNLTPNPLLGGPSGTPPTVQPANPDPLPIPPLTTDGRGRFVFTDIAAGSYRLAVVSPGYVRQEYGQRIFPGQGTLLNLMAGETIGDLVMRVTQTGNVSGHITDNMGQLAVNVRVALLKASYNAIGQRTYEEAGNTATNDRGEYRLFWVTPGRYYIAAGSAAGPAPGGGGFPNDPMDIYSLTFYPGAPDPSRATTIDVRSGSESTADFSVNRQQAYKVRGRVADGAGGPPPAAINVSFAYQGITGQNSAFNKGQIYDPATGAFEVQNILPGAYVVQVSAGPVDRAAIEIVNSNVDNLSFILGSGSNVTGRVRMDNPAQSSTLTSVRVQLRSLTAGLTVGNQTTDADGNFKIESIGSGEYRAVVSSTPPELYVKELHLGGFDLMTQTIRASSGTPIVGTLEVVLSPNVSQIDGVVMDDRHQPAPGVQAVLVPDRNREHTELFKAATTDQNGHYTIRNVPPGDYKLFAWEALEPFGYFDPDLLNKSESQAKALHVIESSKLNVELPWIRETP